MAVWRRAAELQAEAAAQLEQRLRETRDTRALAAANPLAAPGAPPTDSYKLADVQAAAAEAGISARYVALALAEQRAPDVAPRAGAQLTRWKEWLATRVLGTSQRTLSVTRRLNASPKAVLQALGNAWTGTPWQLTLEDTLGGHPLDGGTLVFALPDMNWSGAAYRWTWTRYGAYVSQLRVTLHAAERGACEVTMSLDLRGGLSMNLGAIGAVSGIFALAGGPVAAAFAKASLGLAGLGISGALLGGGTLAALVSTVGLGAIYRWELRAAEKEMQAALTAIEGGLRLAHVFGDAPRMGALPRPGEPAPEPLDPRWL
jgi:predicted secreted protein